VPNTLVTALLADTILVIHVAYVAYVVGGAGALILGMIGKTSWVRNPWFRYTHLAAIGVVAIQALLSVPCILTVWEYNLRVAAGQSISELPFVPRLLRALIFFEAPAAFFTTLYVVFGLAVLLALVLLPPRRRGS
jgi:hypothetical protein